jgi:hypothetical protein
MGSPAIHIPSLEEVVEIERRHGREPSRRDLGFRHDGRMHALIGKASITDPDGSVAWEDDWRLNALTDQGEQSVLEVYFREQANPTKYGALLNMGTDPVDTDTIATLTETKAPGTGGYARQQFLAADWGASALVGGDYKTTAAQKTWGAAVTTAWTVTHVALVTTATGVASPATLFLLWIALSGATTVNVGQTFNFTAAVTAQ